jgi:hypothetical protein
MCHSIKIILQLLSGINMQRQTKVYPAPPSKQSDYASQQAARVSAQQKAENERAQKRLEMDARLDVNASKWRYVCKGE